MALCSDDRLRAHLRAAVGAVILVMSCARTKPLRVDELVGGYYLYIGSEYSNPNQPDDRLVLHRDGTYQHTYVSGSAHRASSGTWRVSGTHVVINEWQDYAGITSLRPRGERSVDYNVFAEGEPPSIILDSDQNIFYDRRPKTASASKVQPNST